MSVEPLYDTIPICEADGLLCVGRTYLLEQYDHGDQILARIKTTVSFPPGYLVFDILGIKPGPGNTLKIHENSGNPGLTVAMDSDEYSITEIQRDEIPTFVHWPYKTPFFDRAIRGEP